MLAYAETDFYRQSVIDLRRPAYKSKAVARQSASIRPITFVTSIDPAKGTLDRHCAPRNERRVTGRPRHRPSFLLTYQSEAASRPGGDVQPATTAPLNDRSATNSTSAIGQGRTSARLMAAPGSRALTTMSWAACAYRVPESVPRQTRTTSNYLASLHLAG